MFLSPIPPSHHLSFGMSMRFGDCPTAASISGVNKMIYIFNKIIYIKTKAQWMCTCIRAKPVPTCRQFQCTMNISHRRSSFHIDKVRSHGIAGHLHWARLLVFGNCFLNLINLCGFILKTELGTILVAVANYWCHLHFVTLRQFNV